MPFGELRDGNRVFTAVNAATVSAADWNEFQDQIIACVMPYASPYAGIADTNAGNMFMVQPSASATPARGSVALSQATTIDPAGICTDGKYIFYLYSDVSDYIRAINSVTGATVWSTALDHPYMTNICTDGAYVYVGDNVHHELNAYSCATGTKVVQAGNNVMHSGDASCISCNGTHVVALNNEADCQSTVFAVAAGVLTRTATEVTFNNGAEAIYCADTFFMVGTTDTWDGGVNISQVSLTNPHTVLASWTSAMLNGANAIVITPSGFLYDGSFVYMSGDGNGFQIGAEFSPAVKLAPNPAAVVQTASSIIAYGIDRGGVLGGAGICGDGKYIYITTTTPTLEMLDPRTMVIVYSEAAAATLHWSCCDGVSYIGYDTAGTGSIKRFYNGENTVGYRRGAATDPRRFPIQGALAVPVW